MERCQRAFGIILEMGQEILAGQHLERILLRVPLERHWRSGSGAPLAFPHALPQPGWSSPPYK